MTEPPVCGAEVATNDDGSECAPCPSLATRAYVSQDPSEGLLCYRCAECDPDPRAAWREIPVAEAMVLEVMST